MLLDLLTQPGRPETEPRTDDDLCIVLGASNETSEDEPAATNFLPLDDRPAHLRAGWSCCGHYF